MGFWIIWEFLGFFGIFWDFLLESVRDFFRVIYPSIFSRRVEGSKGARPRTTQTATRWRDNDTFHQQRRSASSLSQQFHPLLEESSPSSSNIGRVDKWMLYAKQCVGEGIVSESFVSQPGRIFENALFSQFE